MIRAIAWAAVLVLLVACSASAPERTPQSVLDAFTTAGLTVNNVTTTDVLTPEVANAAPSCQGARFDVQGDDGARVIICGSEGDAEAVERYYVALGEATPMFFSHTHRAGSLVLQMNGALPVETFQRYVAALP